MKLPKVKTLRTNARWQTLSYLSQVKNKVSLMDGEFLAPGAVSLGWHDALRIICKERHAWNTTVEKILSGCWCPICTAKEEMLVRSFGRLKEVVSSRNGRILTPFEKYQGWTSRVELVCKEGHQWETLASGILKGSWCKKCWGQRRRGTIEVPRTLACKFGGELLSEKFLGIREPLLWKCANGHEFSQAYDSVKKGNWCGICSAKKRQEESCQRISQAAQDRGGTLLSMEFKGWKIKLNFRCREGHEWMAAPSAVVKGAWCPKCYLVESRLGLSALADLAKSRGGKIISKEYGLASDSYEWQCKSGHVFKLTYTSAARGSWCARCTPVKNSKKSLDDIKDLAREKGGECLSSEYINSISKMRWKCGEGHVWETTAQIVLSGSWCPECRRLNSKRKIDDLVEMAKSRGGECLSEEFVANHSLYEWRCAKGHEFPLSFTAVRKGAWCRKCTKEKEWAEELIALREIAKKKGGDCLSSTYVPTKKLLWRCEEGHEWEALANNIRLKTWCPTCSRSRQRNSLAQCNELAEKRGGRCLELIYKNNWTPVEFECKFGHRWKACFSAIKRGTWCPECAGTKVKSIDEMREHAKARGGLCLSSNYQSGKKRLLWQCAKGHQWRAPSQCIAKGTWCPMCSRGIFTFSDLVKAAQKNRGTVLSPPSDYKNGDSLLRVKCNVGHVWEIRARALGKGNWCRQCSANRNRVSILDLQRYAEERGGRCLSETLPITKGKSWVIFKCDRGHSWRANGPQVIRAKTWCRKCHYEDHTKTIEDMQEMAREKGGVCLSPKYMGQNVKLEWKCADKHTWWTTPSIIKSGSWCIKCTSPRMNSYEKLKALVEERGGRCLSREYLGSRAKMWFRCKKGH